MAAFRPFLRRTAVALPALAICLVAAPMGAASAATPSTTLVSISPNGAQPPDGTKGGDAVAISGSGRYVVFTTSSTFLGKPSDGGISHLAYRDLLTHTTKAVDVTPAGALGNASAYEASVVPGGRYVAFSSGSTNLVSGQSGSSVGQVYIRDMFNGVTKLVSLTVSGSPASAQAFGPSVSSTGRFVSFSSAAAGLTADRLPKAGAAYVYLRDTEKAVTYLVSRDSANVPITGLGSKVIQMARRSPLLLTR